MPTERARALSAAAVGDAARAGPPGAARRNGGRSPHKLRLCRRGHRVSERATDAPEGTCPGRGGSATNAEAPPLGMLQTGLEVPAGGQTALLAGHVELRSGGPAVPVTFVRP